MVRRMVVVFAVAVMHVAWMTDSSHGPRIASAHQTVRPCQGQRSLSERLTQQGRRHHEGIDHGRGSQVAVRRRFPEQSMDHSGRGALVWR
jgi:hypothetical protein